MAGDTALAKVAARVTQFWHLVPEGAADECWAWRGSVDKDGYGTFFFGGKMRGAHELALTFATGEAKAKGLDTCHSRGCTTRLCCNPGHLRFDTRASNVADAVAAGTALGHGRLTAADVRLIRTRIAHGAKQQDLADAYGVTNSTISMIKTRKRFAHVR